MIPLAKDGLNNGLRFIGEENFDATDAYVPATVRTIDQVAFEQGQPVYKWEYDQYSFPHIEYYPTVFGSSDYDHEDEEMMEQTMENHTIHGYEGTTAQFYAERGKFNFVSLGDDPPEPPTEPPTEPTEPTDDFLLGDVNFDGTVNASDAALILIAAASNGAGKGYASTLPITMRGTCSRRRRRCLP